MKKITFLFLILFATANIYSQTYTISFAATGAATTVDSVKVENLTQVTTVTWHASDVLQLVLTNGINEVGVNEENLQVFPNPMQGQAEISFYAKQTGNATISIYDIAGKEVLQIEEKLLQGTQKYQLTGLKQGIYFINISGNGYFYTAKLISQNATTGEAKIKYIASEKSETVTNTLKSTKATITMLYTTGDNLRFTGYAGSLTAIVNDVPTSSKTITFTFVALLPTVTTTAASSITATTATSGGNVTDDGGVTVTARGVCYATTANPTTANSTVANGSGTGTFVANITGLTASTPYYVRAYATNSVGTAYGNQISFTTGGSSSCGQSFTDSRDATVYPTVQIGTQCWMGKNLAYLPSVVGPATGSDIIPYYYVYGYNGTSVSVAKATYNYINYGVLYNWKAAMNGAASSTANPSGVQGICPTGWHLPSDAEWTQLSTYLGGPYGVGDKLKETGNTHWTTSNNNATNSSGFTALPGGCRSIYGNFGNIGSSGYWWTSTVSNLSLYAATYRTIYYQLTSGNEDTRTAFSVRCVKDTSTIIPSLPTVTTSAASSITSTTATSGGNVTADGGATVTARGVCYATTTNPTTANNTVASGNGTAQFVANITGLTASTTYYVRAYATNSVGTAYGNEINFTTFGNISCPQTFTDSRDGIVYSSILVGGQCWMAENLKYLPSVDSTWSSSTARYYVYNYYGTNVTAAKTSSNYTTYGVLYNWFAAMAGSSSSTANPSGVQGACPIGWHLPSVAEWTQLSNYLGEPSVPVGGKMKETGTIHWESPNTGATNSIGFTALPGGNATASPSTGDLDFMMIGHTANWWSTTEDNSNPNYASSRYIYHDDNELISLDFAKRLGFSIRCVKD